jgi:multicomponent Na+:H+ antiporter subunit C
MIPVLPFTLAGIALFGLGLHAFLVRGHLVWKVLAMNVMGTGIFLILVSAPARLDPGVADPVPQAMVLTGIVVAAGVTAFALGVALRVVARTGRPTLHSADEPRPTDEGDGSG